MKFLLYASLWTKYMEKQNCGLCYSQPSVLLEWTVPLGQKDPLSYALL